VKDLIKLGGMPKTLILQCLWTRFNDQSEDDDESAPDEPVAEPQGDKSIN